MCDDDSFCKIISAEGFSDFEADDEKKAVNIKEVCKKITATQSEKLMLKIDGRTDGFKKGKMKSSESAKLLDEWNQLATELNAIGPPQHSSAKWRRIWTKMKYRKKHGASSSNVRTINENKEVEYQGQINQSNEACAVYSENGQGVTVNDGQGVTESEHIRNDEVQKFKRKRKSEDSSVPRSEDHNVNNQQSATCIKVYRTLEDDNVTSTVDPVESVHPQLTIEQQIAQIVHAIATLSEEQALAHATINRKIDDLAKKQSEMNVKLSLLAKEVGFEM